MLSELRGEECRGDTEAVVPAKRDAARDHPTNGTYKVLAILELMSHSMSQSVR